MKRKFYIPFILFLSLTAPRVFADEGGAASPRELLSLSAEAVEKGNFEKLKSLHHVTAGSRAEGMEALVSLFRFAPKVRAFLKSGHDRFGDGFEEALSYAGFVLNAFAHPPDYRKALQSGKITVTGDAAEVVVSSGEKTSNGSTSQSSKTSLIRVGGRWYYAADVQHMPAVYGALKEFVEKGESVLREAKTKEQLAQGFKKLLPLFKDF